MNKKNINFSDKKIKKAACNNTNTNKKIFKYR